ncbi:hypothetical protein JCM10207_004140 [Rhodosporidiobolus poonsookiae]
MQVGKSIARSTKNLWSFSDCEARVRDATSNEPHGPSVAQMSELAQWSFNQQDSVEIVTMLDKRLNDKGKSWRHVYKALTVIDYLCHYGSYAIVRYFRDNIHLIKTLKEFQHVDDHGTDVGYNVRQAAIALSSLLIDEDRLRRERGNGGKSLHDQSSLSRHLADPHALPSSSSSRPRDEEKLGRRRSQSQPLPAIASNAERLKKLREEQRAKERVELGKAMQASTEDESKRLGLLREQAGQRLFDDEFASAAGKKEVESSAPLVDIASSTQPAPPDPMQQLYEQQLRQNAAMQAQQNDLAQQFALMQLAQQQQQQQQATDFYALQHVASAQQAAYEQYQAAAQAQYAAQQQQMQQQMHYAQPLQPVQPQMTTPTPGRNNPFAAFSPASPSPGPSPSSVSPSPALAPQATAFLAPPSPSPTLVGGGAGGGRPRAYTDDPRHAELARFVGQGGGVDTFGNVGGLRVPSGPHFASYTGHS